MLSSEPKTIVEYLSKLLKSKRFTKLFNFVNMILDEIVETTKVDAFIMKRKIFQGCWNFFVEEKLF